MIGIKDILGLKIAGFRYGKAPSGGLSYNTREREYEPGVSMAKVGYGKEIKSFAIDGQSKKKYYYIGEIAGTGGDDEICLKNLRQLTKSEYYKELTNTAEASNLVIDYYADRKIRLLEKGYDIGMTIEDVEKFRKKYKIKTNKNMDEVQIFKKEMPKSIVEAYKKNAERPPKNLYKVVGGLAKYSKPRHSTLYLDAKYKANGSPFCKTLADAKKQAARISGTRKKAWVVHYFLK